jgi:predicted CDP-diglyceride synthetase/phosphatidate cytidylyltransferase
MHQVKEDDEVEKISSEGSSSRWKNYRTRCFWGMIMIILFTALIIAGHFAIVLLVLAIHTTTFKEVVGIAHLRYKERKLPWFRTLNW